MSTSALEARLNGAPRSEDVEKNRFTAGKPEEQAGSAMATKLNLAAATAQTSASVSNKPRPPGAAYLGRSLKTPFTATLPSSSKFIIAPTKARENNTEKKNVPNNDDVDTTVAPQDAGGQPSEEQRLLQKRRSELQLARCSVFKARRTHKTVKRSLSKLNDFLFTEKTYERNGKKVTEIHLSRFALDVLEKQQSGTEHNPTDEAAGASDHGTSDHSEVGQSDTLFIHESQMD
ncbi:uncharacterized protein LOC119170304 [Rhipicephalus microplus]|uniref:uncharacterized protein LOC119170304 n=1 Tax=Rhipicephalus microplus TaxID=6941 RepID=UPI003F6BC18A